MKSSLSSLTGCEHTRFGWKVATLRRTPIATRTRSDSYGADFDYVVADAAPWRLPRTQPWDGLALRGGAGDAGTERERSGKIAGPHRDRPRLGHRQRRADRRFSRHDAAAYGHPLLRRRGPDRPWHRPPCATSAPAVGSHAGGLPRLDRLVISDGFSA